MKTLILCLFMFTGVAAQTTLTETQKIEKLISYVEDMEDATFVRNGAEFSCDKAAKHLRGKWKRDAALVKNARDFIKYIATESSTSGKPYTIRYKDGTVKKTGEVLMAQLIKIEQGK
jgi:hypothetical protein